MTIPLESPSTRAIERNVDRLIEIVDRYDLHMNLDLLHAIESLRKRTATHRLTLAVFGDSRESKSSLIDALLDTTLAEASIPPSTAACTYLAYGLRAECAVTLADNMTAWLPLEQLAGFVSEKAPASNLKKVLVRFPNAALESGLVVIDTPELGDDPKALLSCTAAAVAEADACVFIVKAGGELNENVIAFLGRMRGGLDKFFFVLESVASLSGVEQEKSLELVRRSLERRCGLAKPRVALLCSVSPEKNDAKPHRERSGACRRKLLGFARMSWHSVMSNEVARVAGETLAQADSALNLRETAPLERMRLRRVVKALNGISRQSAGLALESDAAMRTLVEPLMETADAGSEPPLGSAPAVAAEPVLFDDGPAVSGQRQLFSSAFPAREIEKAVGPKRESFPAAETAPPIVPAHGAVAGSTQTTQGVGTMPTVPSFTVWIAPPSRTPFPAQALWGDTTAPIQSEPARGEEPEPPAAPSIPRRAVPRIFDTDTDTESASSTGPAGEPDTFVTPPHGHEFRQAKIPPDSPARSFEWCANRIAWADDLDDDEEFTRDGIGPLWKVAGSAALLAAVLVIAWAVVIVVRPNYVRPSFAHMLAWRPAAWRPAAPPVQPGPSSPAPLIAARPVPSQASGDTASNEVISTPPLETPPAETSLPAVAAAAPATVKTGPVASIAARENKHSAPDAALESVLDKWIAASRSGNIEAQAACYAPLVGTYFKSQNVTRQQVQRDKERISTGTAGVQNYHITTLGISDQGNGQKAVLLQKDWDTPTGQGPGFAGTEIERLAFAQVEGQWKIVGEQEVKLPKLHRTRVPRQMATNF